MVGRESEMVKWFSGARRYGFLQLNRQIPDIEMRAEVGELVGGGILVSRLKIDEE